MNLNKGCIEICQRATAYNNDFQMNLNKGCIEMFLGIHPFCPLTR